MRMTALLASRRVDVMRPAAQPLLQVAASGLPRAPTLPPACALAALRRASSSRSHLHNAHMLAMHADTMQCFFTWKLACLLREHAYVRPPTASALLQDIDWALVCKRKISERTCEVPMSSLPPQTRDHTSTRSQDPNTHGR